MNEMFRIVLVAAVTLGTNLTLHGAEQEKKKAESMNTARGLRIGWASRDVTPKGKVNLAGQFEMRITDRVKDPVTVTALAISAGEDPASSVVFVSCDTVSNPAYLTDACREKVRALAGDIPTDHLILNATHTHTAPDTRLGVYKYEALTKEEAAGLIGPEAYRTFLVEKMAEAVIESWKNRKEGFVAWGLGEAVAGHNRRAVYLKDFSERPDFEATPGQKVETNAAMYGNTNDPWFSHIEGYEDHTVQFLFTFDRDKKLTGAAVNLVCPSQETEGLREISADFWHDVRVALREKHGRDLFVLPQCSAAGDQSPHLLLNKKAQERRLKLQGIDARQQIARRVAGAFDETFSWAKNDLQTQLPLRHTWKTVNLPKRKITADECRQNRIWIEELKKQADQPMAPRFIARCQKVIDEYEAQQKDSHRVQPVEIHVVRLGDVVFATNPFELFLDYGVRIQARSPAVQTFIVQLAARGIEWGGSYLPSKRAESGGGYSASVYDNPVGSEGGSVLVEETLGMINALWTTGEAKVRFNRWPGGRMKCLTLSYDDGNVTDRQLVAIMNCYGIRGAFHLCSGHLDRKRCVQASDVAATYKGQEISCHMRTHPHLTQLSREQVLAEAADDRRRLEALAGYPIHGMSYPYGNYNDVVIGLLRSCGIEYARTTKATGQFDLPADWMRWHPSCHHRDCLALADRFLALPEDPTRTEPYCFYVWGHSYEFDRNNNWDLIETFCKKMGGRKDLWYATNAEILEYMQAVRKVRLASNDRQLVNPTDRSVWVTLLPSGASYELKAGATCNQDPPSVK